MKIVLINPPSPFEKEPAMNPPLGLCYIAAYLKSINFTNIEMIDFSLYQEYDYRQDKKYLEKIPLDASVYGITCVTPQYQWLYEISKYIRANNPDACIVAGGPHPTNMAKETIDECNLDYAIRGEGEIVFGDICDKKWRNSRDSISGIEIGQRLLGKIIPDRSLTPLSAYKRTIDGELAAHINTLRGCPYGCYYCDMSRGNLNNGIYYRNVDTVIAEMDDITKRYNIRSFVIYDDCFILNKKRVAQFCEEFAKRGYKWRCFSRVDHVDYDILKLMKDAGLTSITFGIESGDDTILKNINKCITVEQNRDALLLAKKVGIPVRSSLMYGNPGENYTSLVNTLNLIEETQPDEWNLAVLSPIPGSEFWEHPEKHGIKLDKKWLHEQMYEPCNRFANTGIGKSYISIDSMTDDEFQGYLSWFTEELEWVCPRKKIQDTIQEIRYGQYF
jgi:anaerobic magnesium-protoporphyrin IX monomethyl ester cyclase